MLGLTDGNLASHLKNWKVWYIDVKKQFVDRKPRTTYSRSPTGETAFKVHLQGLEALIRQTAD
jgi:hypothetical protein